MLAKRDVTGVRVAWLLVALGGLSAAPAGASSIALVGDKDGFGLGLGVGDLLPCSFNAPIPNPPCISPIVDWRSAAEAAATTGAQLTDVYSALYAGTELDCPAGCSPNGGSGLVILPFAGELIEAEIRMLLADFESSQNLPMLAWINGIPIGFFFDHGYRVIAEGVLVLTPEMIAAANAAGRVELLLDHSSANNARRSFDYVAIDYFELHAVPEPGTWLLIGTGLAVLIGRRRGRARRGARQS